MTTNQPLSLAAAMALAEQRRADGQLAVAEDVLRQILQARPTHAPALHLLGIVLHQQGQTEAALRLLAQAIEVDPQQSVYYANFGEMCRALGRLDEAIAAGERAIELDANAVAALSNVGIAYYDSIRGLRQR